MPGIQVEWLRGWEVSEPDQVETARVGGYLQRFQGTAAMLRVSGRSVHQGSPIKEKAIYLPDVALISANFICSLTEPGNA